MMAKKAPNPTDKHVGARVRMRRMMLGMSQETLGDALGLTFQQVQKYERGANRIGASRLWDLSRVLDCPMSFFFEDMDDATASASPETKSTTTAATGIASRAPGRLPGRTTSARTISTVWHPDWRLKVGVAEPKRVTKWVYNGQPDPSAGGTVASCAPAAALVDGKPIAVVCKKIEQATTDENGASGFSATPVGSARVWTYTYNQWGQVLTATGPRGNVDSGSANYAPDTTTSNQQIRTSRHAIP